MYISALSTLHASMRKLSTVTRRSIRNLCAIWPYVISGCALHKIIGFHSDSDIVLQGRDHLHRNVLPQRRLPGYTFWSSDFHIGPIADLKDLFTPLGMNVIDKSLSAHCHLKNTCATDLKVVNGDNGITLGECPNRLRRDFYEAYAKDPEMRTVDAFLCNHACGLCELFMPFNRSLIVIASTRYEIGRHETDRWLEWNDNLRRIAANPRNLVAANNVYDAEYIKYFTGIKDVPVIPSYCGYVKEVYSPVRKEILVGPSRGVHETLYHELQEMGKASGLDFARIRDIYPTYSFSQLVMHPAIVLFPYQVSIMSLFEYYRMAIPIFAPSPRLLTEWHLHYRIMRERTWDGVLLGRLGNASRIPRHPSSYSHPYDPNNEVDEAAILFWIKFADFYVFPHVQIFDSFEDLIGKLQHVDLDQVSQAMRRENARMKESVRSQWERQFERIFAGVEPSSTREQAPQSHDFDYMMEVLYKVKLGNKSCVGNKP